MAHVVVTGASGYIGREVVRLCNLLRISVTVMGRKAVDGASQWIPYDMGADTLPTLPEDTDAVIHLAYMAYAGPQGEQQDVAVTQRLQELAVARGARFVFASSLSAHENAPTGYGRSKYAIEQLLHPQLGYAARFGLVYGGQPAGLFKQLLSVLRKGVMPAFMPAPVVYPIHVRDCAQMLLMLALEYTGDKHIIFAGQPPLAFTDVLRDMSRSYWGGAPLPLPLPQCFFRAFAAIFGAKTAEKIGIGRFLALFLPPEQSPRLGAFADVPLTPGTFPQGLVRSAHAERRALLQEGRVFLRYICKAEPKNILLRRYARMVEKVDDGRPLYLPLVCRCPAVFSLFDLPLSRFASVRGRLRAASLLAEASPWYARRFLKCSADSRGMGAVKIIVALAQEALRIACAVLALPWTLFILRKRDAA